MTFCQLYFCLFEVFPQHYNSTNLFVLLLWCWAATHFHTLSSLHLHRLPQNNIQITGQLLAKHYAKPSLCQGRQGFYVFTSFLAQLFVSSRPWTRLLVSSFPLVLTPLALYSGLQPRCYCQRLWLIAPCRTTVKFLSCSLKVICHSFLSLIYESQ